MPRLNAGGRVAPKHILIKAHVAARDTKATGHSGILESARAVVEDLQATGVLEGLMLHPRVPPPPPFALAFVWRRQGRLALVFGLGQDRLCRFAASVQVAWHSRTQLSSCLFLLWVCPTYHGHHRQNRKSVSPMNGYKDLQ